MCLNVFFLFLYFPLYSTFDVRVYHVNKSSRSVCVCVCVNWCLIIIPILSTGGVTEAPCPYKCISDRFHMPHCYTALEELIYTFGGPWLFGLILLGILILLALVLSVARMKYVGGDELPALVPAQPVSRIDHSFPFLESLNEVCLQFLPFLFILSHTL